MLIKSIEKQAVVQSNWYVIIYCPVVEITDTQPGHKIHFLCKQDALANIHFPYQLLNAKKNSLTNCRIFTYLYPYGTSDTSFHVGTII